VNWIEVACEKCGATVWVHTHATATHLYCPKRKPGQVAPKYRQVETVKL
jgi:hypothetical protein